MKRSTHIIIGILLGAFAASLGVGIFLKKANDDRRRLAEQLQTVAEQASKTHQTSQRVAEDANKKLLAANREVTQAMELIQALKADQALMANASELPAFPSSLLRTWAETTNVNLGLSLRLPPGISATNTSHVLMVQPWLEITSYTEERYQTVLQSVTGTTPVMYIRGGHLLTGVRGADSITQIPTMILRVRFAGKNILLIRIQEHPPTGVKESTVRNILASLRFES